MATRPPILLIDSSSAWLLSNSILARSVGFAPTIARSGQEALELFKKNTFRTIALDYWLPDMTGADCTQRLRESSPDVASKALIIGYACGLEPELAAAWQGAGADLVLNKDDSESLLLDALSKRYRSNL